MRQKEPKALSQKENHCPFGCQDHQLGELEYCCHLVGFTNRGKVVEKLSMTDRGKWMVGGFVTDANGVVRRNTEPVLSTDKLVNPTDIVQDRGGVQHRRKKWVSDRVYRKCTDAEAAKWRQLYATPVDPEADIVEEELV